MKRLLRGRAASRRRPSEVQSPPREMGARRVQTTTTWLTIAAIGITSLITLLIARARPSPDPATQRRDLDQSSAEGSGPWDVGWAPGYADEVGQPVSDLRPPGALLESATDGDGPMSGGS